MRACAAARWAPAGSPAPRSPRARSAAASAAVGSSWSAADGGAVQVDHGEPRGAPAARKPLFGALVAARLRPAWERSRACGRARVPGLATRDLPPTARGRRQRAARRHGRPRRRGRDRNPRRPRRPRRPRSAATAAARCCARARASPRSRRPRRRRGARTASRPRPPRASARRGGLDALGRNRDGVLERAAQGRHPRQDVQLRLDRIAAARLDPEVGQLAPSRLYPSGSLRPRRRRSAGGRCPAGGRARPPVPPRGMRSPRPARNAGRRRCPPRSPRRRAPPGPRRPAPRRARPRRPWRPPRSRPSARRRRPSRRGRR